MIDLTFRTNFKISPPKIFCSPQMPRLTNYIEKLCENLYEIIRGEIPMSRSGSILAAITAILLNKIARDLLMHCLKV